MKAAAQTVLVREADEFFRRLRDLARPIPRATPDDEIRRCYEQLEATGWNSSAIDDLLLPEFRDGERLSLIARRRRDDWPSQSDQGRSHREVPTARDGR